MVRLASRFGAALYQQTELHLLVKVIGFIASVSLLYVMVILPILSVMWSNEEGQPFSPLDVYKGSVETGKHLVEIKLDPKTVVNNIGYQLADEGIPESNSL